MPWWLSNNRGEGEGDSTCGEPKALGVVRNANLGHSVLHFAFKAWPRLVARHTTLTPAPPRLTSGARARAKPPRATPSPQC